MCTRYVIYVIRYVIYVIRYVIHVINYFIFRNFTNKVLKGKRANTNEAV